MGGLLPKKLGSWPPKLGSVAGTWLGAGADRVSSSPANAPRPSWLHCSAGWGGWSSAAKAFRFGGMK